MTDQNTETELGPVDILRAEFVPTGIVLNSRENLIRTICMADVEQRQGWADELTAACQPVEELSPGGEQRLDRITRMLQKDRAPLAVVLE